MKKFVKQFVEFVKVELVTKLMDALKVAIKEFEKTLWEEIKNEVIGAGQKVIGDIEAFSKTKECKEKEDEIIDKIMTKVKLPILLKPFKGLVKKMVKKKVEEVFQEVLFQLILNKGKEFVG